MWSLSPRTVPCAAKRSHVLRLSVPTPLQDPASAPCATVSCFPHAPAPDALPCPFPSFPARPGVGQDNGAQPPTRDPCRPQAASLRAGSTRTGRTLRGPQAAVRGVTVRYGKDVAEGLVWGLGLGSVTDPVSPAGWPGQLCAAAVPTPGLPAPGHRAGELLPSLQRYAWPGGSPLMGPWARCTSLCPTSLPSNLPPSPSAPPNPWGD